MKQFILALTFLTRLYIPNRYEMSEKDFAGSVWFYPIIGLVMGGLLSLIYLGLLYVTDAPNLLSLLLVISYLLISGGLHLDGLADSFDGLFSGRDKARIFEIMSDSRIGSFGVIGLILYFITMFIALQYANWGIVLLFPLIGKGSILVSAGISEYAKEKGMGKIIVDATTPAQLVFAVLLSFIIGALVNFKSILPIAITYLFVVIMTKAIHKKLSGITGDIMGMTVEVSQCLFLLLSAIIL